MGGVEFAWIGQRHGYHRALGLAKVLGTAMEMTLGYRLGTVDAVAHLNGVEIYLHNPLLGPEYLYEECEIHLKAFTHPTAPWP